MKWFEYGNFSFIEFYKIQFKDTNEVLGKFARLGLNKVENQSILHDQLIVSYMPTPNSWEIQADMSLLLLPSRFAST